MNSIVKVTQAASCAFAWVIGCSSTAALAEQSSSSSTQLLADVSAGENWAGPGRTFGEQHYSPLVEINAGNVSKLGLAWSMDLPTNNSVTQPLAVNGVLFFSTGYSVIHAVDAASGKPLWSYDPNVPQVAGKKLRLGWGSRGIAWWNGKVYTGTLDGRLIAIDAVTGKPLWSVLTVGRDDGRYITGAPRVFDGKVIIGHGGADVDSIRGYVTTYDAESGKQLWRFHVVPGNPADGFESKAMEMAAKTWSGEWWKYGGGGTVWNAMSYDPVTDTVIIGTGNGAPWNRKIRSAGKGDNLFLCAIVALDAKTGEYKWHYQINPGESWDYNADMDMEFADLVIGGKPRKVLITAPKNGFLYVIDRLTGQFISAEPYVHVSWATGIDKKTGRPLEVPNNRYESGPFTLAPGPVGAHSWLPMAFSPKTGLVYIPTLDQAAIFTDKGFALTDWQRAPGFSFNGGVDVQMVKDASSALVAWNPVTQTQAWRIPIPTIVSGGVMATAGNLVFQGGLDGTFNAYDASSGSRLWTFAAKAPVMAPPITYSVGGRQYVTVLTGAGTSLVLLGKEIEKYGISYRGQQRRVLTFALGSSATLSDAPAYRFSATADPDYRADSAAALRGWAVYAGTCLMCHGKDGYATGGIAPDLRASSVITSDAAFESIVAGGALVPNGMPRFDDFSKQTREDIRQYLRSLAATARQADPGAIEHL